MAPKYIKTIICLANSRKISGRCVAGKEVLGGKCGLWIRPVSARQTGELSEEERRFENGQDLKLLDVVRIPMIEPRPFGFQKENHLIDNGFYWTKDSVASWDVLRAALDPIGGLLWENSSSSYNGLNDRVWETSADQLNGSLRLIEVKDFKIFVAVEGAEYRKRKVRGQFTFGAARYKLAVTDPVVERQFFAGNDGEFNIGRAILSVSLGEPFEGFAYKLIAGVFVQK